MAVMVFLFIFFKNNISENALAWLEPFYEQEILIYLIYTVSELAFGLIPPEIFMMWGLRSGILNEYITVVIALAVISYVAGAIGFQIGRSLSGTRFYARIKKRYLFRFEKYLERYGAVLVIIAAVTPVPFSSIAILMGSVKFSFGKYLLYSLTRFARFSVYAYIFWQANSL